MKMKVMKEFKEESQSVVGQMEDTQDQPLDLEFTAMPQ